RRDRGQLCLVDLELAGPTGAASQGAGAAAGPAAPAGIEEGAPPAERRPQPPRGDPPGGGRFPVPRGPDPPSRTAERAPPLGEIVIEAARQLPGLGRERPGDVALQDRNDLHRQSPRSPSRRVSPERPLRSSSSATFFDR